MHRNTKIIVELIKRKVDEINENYEPSKIRQKKVMETRVNNMTFPK